MAWRPAKTDSRTRSSRRSSWVELGHTMGLHPPKPIRKTKERICTQKPIKRFRHKANCRVHRHASDFRQSYRSGFAKVRVVSSNLIARSKNSLIKSVSDTLPSVAKPLWVLGWDWGTGTVGCRFFSMRADRFRCVLCPSDGRAQGCMDLACWSPEENNAPEGRRGAWVPICTLLE